MKLLTSLLAVALLFGAAAPPPAQAQGNVSIDLFYDSLSDHGSWMDVGDYGYVWHPRVNDDWEPYRDGHWVHTEAGWTWVSNEPFGWATYHYGRWANIFNIGWIWVPDTEWAPAWVSWRRSPSYVGWAPLPPEARFRRNIGFSAWVDSYYDIGPAHYRFVENRRFGDRDLRSAYVDRSRNVTIINHSTNITNITYANNIIVNRGPDFAVMSRQSDRPIQQLRLQRDTQFSGDPRSGDRSRFNSRQDGDSLRVFAPTLAATSRGAPPTVAPRIERAEVNRGWKGGGIPEAQVSAVREKLRAEATKVPEALPEKPRFERPTIGAVTPSDGDRPGRGKGEGRDRSPDAPPTTATTPGATVPGAAMPAERDRPGQGKGKGKGDPRTSAEADSPRPMPGAPSRAPGDRKDGDSKGPRGEADRDQVRRAVPATPATPAVPASPKTGDTPPRATPAIPAVPATPSPESRRDRATPGTPAVPSERAPRPSDRGEPQRSPRPEAPAMKRPEPPARPSLPSAKRPAPVETRPQVQPPRPQVPVTRPEVQAPRPQTPPERPQIQAPRAPAPAARPQVPPSPRSGPPPRKAPDKVEEDDRRKERK